MPNPQDIIPSQIQTSAIQVIRETSAFIKSQITLVSAEDIEEKELNSLVSYVDKEAEKMLVKGLSSLIPNAGFITEEKTLLQEQKEHTWIIDPLDGTTNFLHQVPHFCISVGLQQDDNILIGIVKEVNTGDEWTAIKGEGAFMNAEPIHVSKKAFHDSLIATGFPYSNDHNYDSYFNLIKHWLTNTRGLRRMGSAALDLCYVASGRFGAYYEAVLNPWDVAAGALIVEEAGGIMSDFSGGSGFLSGKEIIASAPHIFQDVLNVIQTNLKENGHGK